MTRMRGPDCAVMCNLINTHTHTHTTLIPPWEDQREWHRMTRMTRPDCAIMCNLINTHTHTHTCDLINTHTHIHTLSPTYYSVVYFVTFGGSAWRLIQVFSITVGFSPNYTIDPRLFKYHVVALSFQPIM